MSRDRPTVIRVRRLPDQKRLLGSTATYEVGGFGPGGDEPTWSEVTTHPASVLRDHGVHPTDVHDYLARADESWDGGTGEWRSGLPPEDL